MGEIFELEIEHNGKLQIFEGELRTLGYTHKIYIDVNGVAVIFEPDEERNFRAIVEGGNDKVHARLIEKIIKELEESLK